VLSGLSFPTSKFRTGRSATPSDIGTALTDFLASGFALCSLVPTSSSYQSCDIPHDEHPYIDAIPGTKRRYRHGSRQTHAEPQTYHRLFTHIPQRSLMCELVRHTFDGGFCIARGQGSCGYASAASSLSTKRMVSRWMLGIALLASGTYLPILLLQDGPVAHPSC
jgi:hypothetical protein